MESQINTRGEVEVALRANMLPLYSMSLDMFSQRPLIWVRFSAQVTHGISYALVEF